MSDVVSSTAGHDQSTSQLDNDPEGSYDYQLYRIFHVKNLQYEVKFVRTCATMPDHVASASMWPHFPDEAIIILIILVIMAFSGNYHPPSPTRSENDD